MTREFATTGVLVVDDLVSCSGTLIGCDRFLTAAHCVCQGFPGCGLDDVDDQVVFLQHAGFVPVRRAHVHPDYDFPALAVLGPAALALAVRGQRWRSGLWLGLVFGLAFFVPLLSWTGIYVGPLPWLALAGWEALQLELLGGATALVSRLRLWPLWTAALWVADEALRGRFVGAHLECALQPHSPFGEVAAHVPEAAERHGQRELLLGGARGLEVVERRAQIVVLGLDPSARP